MKSSDSHSIAESTYSRGGDGSVYGSSRTQFGTSSSRCKALVVSLAIQVSACSCSIGIRKHSL